MKRDARFDAMLRATLTPAQRRQEVAQQAERAKMEAFISSGEAKFFDDVLNELITLSRVKTKAGSDLPFKDLYARACWANPGVRALLLARHASKVTKALLRELSCAAKTSPRLSERTDKILPKDRKERDRRAR